MKDWTDKEMLGNEDKIKQEFHKVLLEKDIQIESQKYYILYLNLFLLIE